MSLSVSFVGTNYTVVILANCYLGLIYLLAIVYKNPLAEYRETMLERSDDNPKGEVKNLVKVGG